MFKLIRQTSPERGIGSDKQKKMETKDIKATEWTYKKLIDAGFKVDLYLPGKCMISLFNFDNSEEKIKEVFKLLNTGESAQFSFRKEKSLKVGAVDLIITNIRA